MIDHGKKSVLGILIDAVDYEGALARILDAAQMRRSYAVSALAVHGVMTGIESPQHKYRLNDFDLIVPDGQPVRWALNLVHGVHLADRVYGPELTLRSLKMAEEEGLQVFFYGTTSAILERLLTRVSELFPKLMIVGAVPSKFRNLDEAECDALQQSILASGAQLLFVGLGCPRQEVFVHEMKERLPMPLLAVGAAFAFIAGELSQAPPTMQRHGLEWLYRLKEEPKRLWRRYLILSPHYLYLLARQYFGSQFSTRGTVPITKVRFG